MILPSEWLIIDAKESSPKEGKWERKTEKWHCYCQKSNLNWSQEASGKHSPSLNTHGTHQWKPVPEQLRPRSYVNWWNGCRKAIKGPTLMELTFSNWVLWYATLTEPGYWLPEKATWVSLVIYILLDTAWLLTFTQQAWIKNIYFKTLNLPLLKLFKRTL